MNVLSGDNTLPQLILPDDVSAPSTRPEKNTICQPNRLNETRSPWSSAPMTSSFSGMVSNWCRPSWPAIHSMIDAATT
ncbi:hypothetical protein D3C86_2116750 [compost metagenome]